MKIFSKSDNKTTAIKCPQCGATLKPDGYSENSICEYCGANVRIARNKGLTAFVERQIDRVGNALKEKREKEEAKQKANDEWWNKNMWKLLVGIIVLIIIIAVMAIKEN